MKVYNVNQKVIASVDITEENFAGNSLHTHAYKGDAGVVEYVDSDGCPTVRFSKSGTATIVGDQEVE